MTLSMPDSIRVADLPGGYPAYLGYCDGEWATAAQLAGRFPLAHRVILTVTGRALHCDGCDIETGDLSATTGAAWLTTKLAASPGSRPVGYASVSVMPAVLTSLRVMGVSRGEVRLLSAHYGQGEHICGPASCGEIALPMDGTQWTDDYDGKGFDMSLLRDDFFGINETEAWVRELPVVRQGDTGEAVRTVQGLCNARGFQGAPLVIDGSFGWKTQGAVEIIQADHKITQDGVVGPLTWPVLLGVA